MDLLLRNEDDIEYRKSKQKLREIIAVANSSSELYFYGAGLRSEEFLQMQKEGFPFFRRPDAFIISSNKSEIVHTKELDGISIETVDEIDLSKKDVCVVVVAMDIYHNEILTQLKKKKCNNIFFLTNAMEHLITRDFLQFYFEKHKLKADFLPFDRNYKIEEGLYEDRIHTYSVMCERDATVNNHFEDVCWISNLQAGAADAEKIIADFRDDKGDNISKLNSYYNELTGLYWVWKNTSHEFTGICHYRRRFESEIALQPILDGTADVVLPLPFVIGVNLKTYYLHWGEQSYYNEMLKVIKDIYPEYKKTAEWCAEHIVFIPNNICITNRKILDEYCNFLFDVIDEVEKRMQDCDGPKQKRCWLSEHVSTIFFIHHLNDYKTVFANLDRRW